MLMTDSFQGLLPSAGTGLFPNPPLEHVTIARNVGRHLAFPDISQLRSGTLLVVYRDGARHVDSSGRIMVCRSVSEGGKVAFGVPSLACNTEWDDRDPSVTQLQDGTVLVNFFRLDLETRRPCITLMTSNDEGHTWSDSWDVEVPGFTNGLAVSDAVVELPSGELLMSVYGEGDNGLTGSFLLRSKDGGRSWSRVVPLAVDRAPIFEEPTLTLLPDGRLFSLLRSDNQGRGFVYQTSSSDEGYTWSPPQPLSVWGYPQDVLVMRDGQLLVTYGYRQLPTGIRACLVNKNKPLSVEYERILRADGHADGELGYPSSVELSDGEIFTAYYFTDAQGGQPYIVGTRYRLDHKGMQL